MACFGAARTRGLTGQRQVSDHKTEKDIFMKIDSVMKSFEKDEQEAVLARLYGSDPADLKRQKERYIKALKEFALCYPDDDDIHIFSTPGRTEIGGNHTDHNNGVVLAAAVSLDIIAIAAGNSDDVVRIKSEGFDPDNVRTGDIEATDDEKLTSKSLIKGICAGFANSGHAIGGFDAYTMSDVPKGSGLSSSAAFEVMTATVMNHLYNEGRIDETEIARIARFSENRYFGKPCGLMDQLACSAGGLVMIDFLNSEQPFVEKIRYDFSSSGYSLLIVNTGGSHEDLNEEYAALPSDMLSVARFLGGETLRDLSLEELLSGLPDLRKIKNDRAILRAIHFYNENRRVREQARALSEKDFESFRKLVIESGDSSWKLCQNCYSCSDVRHQDITLALALSGQLLKGEGAWRVHGGGFAGTIQAFVPDRLVNEYTCKMEALFGAGSCYRLNIRPEGSVRLRLNE